MSRSFSEDGFLQNLFPRLKMPSDVVVGPGDDCAVIQQADKYLVVAVDQVIEGRHYLPSTSPERVGRKLLARNLSDIAAMGATPKYALLSSAQSKDKSETWLESFHDGLLSLAEEFEVALIGGDLAVSENESVASLTIIGEMKSSPVLRSGANVGDVLFTTGLFGNSFLSEHHLDFVPRVKEGEWLSHFGVTAMMDVTDGLLQDVEKVAKSSNCSLVLDEELVNLRSGADLRMAFTDGEDYELVFAVNSEKVNALVSEWPFEVALSKLGYFRGQDLDSYVINISGESLIEKYGSGFDHFNEK